MFSFPLTKNILLTTAMCLGITQFARAQNTPGTIFTNSIKTKDPVVETKYLRMTTTRRVTPEDKNRHELALKLSEGNAARRNSNYEVAVAAYERAVKLDAKDPRAHYGLGNVYIDLACQDSGIAEYQAALNLKNDFRDALIGLGYALANKQRYEEAESQFQQLFKIKKDDTAGRMGLAFVLWKKKKYDDAIERLKQLADTGSNNEDRAAAYLFLGDIHREQKKWENARAAYQQAIALNSAAAATTNFVSIQAYIGLGLVELLPAMERFSRFNVEERKTEDHEQVISAAKKAEEYFRRAIYELKFEHPSAYLLWAVALEYQFQFRAAEEKFSQYLEKVKELQTQLPRLAQTKTCDYGFTTLRANYYHFQASAYEQERLLTTDHQKLAALDQKTIDCLEQLIGLKADDAQAYASLANVYFWQGKYNDAIDQYKNALSRESDESKKASDYFGRATCYENLGRIKDAIDDINRAIKIKPEVPIFYWSLSLLYEQQGNWEEAIASADKAMAREQPPTAHAYYFYATLYFRKARVKGNEADYQKAIELANKTISISSTYSNAYLLLASIYKDLSKDDEAIANYELAANYDPDNPSIYLGLADLYSVSKKNDNAAIQNLMKALALKPDYALAYWRLGKAYARKRNDAEAVKQFQNAIKYDPKLLDAYIDMAVVYDEQGNFDDAIKWALNGTEELPTEYMPYKEAARIYSHYQKNEEAIEYYEKAIGLIKANDAWFGEVMKCRIPRLRGQYAESITCLQKVKIPSTANSDQIPYDIGVSYVASGNKEAARAQYEELKRLKSALAEILLKQINEMK
jgi:tetratricopeptide (TPR) repeat protein